MCTIIQFDTNYKLRHMKSKIRVEAMIKGEIEEYTCDTCGTDFEVISDNKPDSCPGCFRKIIWE